MTWQFFAILQILLSIVDALFQRNTAKLKGLNARSKASLVHILGIFPVGVFWALTHGKIDFSFDKLAMIYGALAGLSIAIASILIWKSAQIVDAANLNIILMLRAVVVTILATVFLAESLSGIQMLGGALVILAGYIASRPDRGELKRSKRGALYATLAAVFFGIGLTLEKAALDMMSFETYLIVGWGLQTVALFVLSFTSLRDDGLNRIKRFAPKLALLGIIVGISGLVYLAALSLSDNTPLVVSFINLKVIGIIIGGYIFLHEKNGLQHKIAGATLALAGFILLVS